MGLRDRFDEALEVIREPLEALRERTPWRHKTNLTRARPPGWNSSLLGPFLELMWSNTIGTYAKLGEARRVQDIDALLWHFAKNASRVKNKAGVAVGLPLMLVLRTHSAFRAATSLSLGGAVPEAMAVLRLCLETAGYASMMQGDGTLATIWLERGDDAAAKQEARKAYGHSNVRNSLKKKNAKIAEHYQSLYELMIDGGAHPNERGFMRNLQVQRREDGGARLIQNYLLADPRELERGLRATGQIGVCVLMIFEMMYPDEFRELGITEKIPIVKKGL
jgi:hypothetical protein